MRKIFTLSVLVIACLLFGAVASNAQAPVGGPYVSPQLELNRFFLFGTTGVTTNSSTSIVGSGFVGSSKAINVAGNGNIGGGMFSSGTIVLGSGVLTGNVQAENLYNISTALTSAGTITGDVDVRGNANLSGATINGSVEATGTITGGTVTGARSPGVQRSALDIQALPVMPTLTTLTSGTLDVPANFILTPGSKYRTLGSSNIKNKTVTFNGPGEYFLDAVLLGGTNKFIYNFGADPNGRIIIRVRGGMSLGKFAAEYAGSAVTSVTEAAKRIFFEVQGTGQAMTMENGSSQASISRWLGTVYAPNGGILIGSGTGNTEFSGAFWSGRGKDNVAGNLNTTLEIRSGVSGTFVAFEPFTPVACTATVAITNPLPVCSPNTVNLTQAAVTAGSTAGLAFTYWTDAAGTVALTNPAAVTTSGTYYIKGTAAVGGCSDIKPVIVTVNPKPTLIITNPATLCSPGTADITLAAVTSGSTAGVTLSYWTDASATITYPTPTTAAVGTYYIKGTTTLGCFDIKPVTVTANATPTVAINAGEGVQQLSTPVAGKLELICNDADQQYTITAVPSNLAGTLTYTWEIVNEKGNFFTTPPPNAASAIITMQGIYKVTVSNGTCSTSAQVTVNSCVVQAGDVQKQDGKVVDPVLTQFYKSLTDPSILNPFFVPPGQTPLVYLRTGPLTGVLEILIDAVTNSISTSPTLGLAFLKGGTGGNDFTEIRTYNNALTGFTINGWLRADRLIDVDANGTPFFNTVYPTYAPYSAGFTKKDEKNFADDIITSGGDKAMASDIAKAAYGIDGTGLTIGIISDSYNTLPNNDVPLELPALNPDGSAIIVRDFASQRSDEGRAMAQIVKDVAPGANLKFHTGFVSEVDMANAIVDLANLNSNIIVDDVTYITAPYFGKGSIAKAVEKVTTGTNPSTGNPYNVKYFTSAGNFANKGYETSFAGTRTFGPAGSTAKIHQFRTSTPTDPGIYQQIQLTDVNPGSYVLVLQWDDKFYSTGDGGTSNDLDIYLTDITGKPILGYNRSHSPTTQSDPFEVLPFSVGGPTTINVMVVNANPTNLVGSNPNIKFKFIIYRGKGVQYLNRPESVNASTIIAHAASPFAMSVAAAAYRPYSADLIKLPADNPTQFVTDNLSIKVESFSSIGFTNTNVSLNKPDFTGPDGVNTSVNLGTSGDIENDNGQNPAKPRFNFYGTSAAAPHAAALAALVMQAKKKFRNQDMTYLDVKSLLQSTATNIQDPAAFDIASGSGLINGMKAIATFAKPKPTITGGLIFTPIGENVLNIDPRAPSVSPPQVVTINGYNFTKPLPDATPAVTGSQVWIGGVPLPAADVTVVSPTQITFVLRTWNPLDPAVNVFTPPTIVDGNDANNDGGKSNDAFFLGVVKENVRIEAVVNYAPRGTDPTTFVYYGETIPQFGYKIFVNNVEDLDPVLADYGLTGLTVESSVLPQGYVPGRYNVFPKLPIIPSDKLQLYNYTTENASLRVKQIPVKITPTSGQVFTYGQSFPKFDYDYTLPLDIYPGDLGKIEGLLVTEYEGYISKDLAILNGIEFKDDGKIIMKSFDKTGALLSRIIAQGADEGVAEVNNGDEGVAEVNNFINITNTAFSNIAFMATQAASEDGVAEVNGTDDGVAEANEAEDGVAEANGFNLDFRTLNTVLDNIDGVAEVNTSDDGVAEVNGGEDGVAEVNSSGDDGVAEVNSGIYSANGILISQSAPLVNNLTVANAVPLFNGMVVINNFSDDGVAEANGLSEEDGVAEANNNDEGVAEVNNASNFVNGIEVNVGIIDNDGVAEANADLNGDGVAEVNASEVTTDGVAEVNGIDGVAEANGSETSGVPTGVKIVYYEDGRIQIFQKKLDPNSNFEDGVAEVNGEEGADGVAEVNNVPINNADLKVADAPELMVILHRTDVNASFITGNYSSVNAVTGIKPGKKHVIIPGGFFTKNWDVTYGLGTFEVHKLGSVINADNISVTYDGEEHPVLATITAGTGTQTISGATYTVTYKNQNASTPAYNSTTAPTTAGVYDAKIDYDGNENYKAATKTVTVRISKINPTITTVVVDGPTFIYNGSPKTATGTVTGLLGVALEPALTFTYTGTLANGNAYSIPGTAPTNAGTYSVIGNFAGNDNYNALSSVPYAFTIGKETPTVIITGTTPVTYDKTAKSLTGNTTGIPTDGNLSPALTFTYNGSPAQPINAGTYTVVGTFVGNDNYVSATSTATLTIDRALPTINASSATVTFNGSQQSLSGTTIGVVADGNLSPALVFTYTPGPAAPTNVGTYAVVANFAGNSNYLPRTKDLTLRINDAAAVTVGVTITSRAYNGQALSPSSVTFTIPGTSTSAGTPSSITYSYTGTSGGIAYGPTANAPINAGTYAVVVSYSGLANYANGSSASKPFEITKATATINVATPQTFTYDGSPKTMVGNVSGVNGETNLSGALTFTYGGLPTAQTNVGIYAVVASYAGNSNYNSRNSAGTPLSLVINPATLTVTPNGPVITNNGTTPTFLPPTLSPNLTGVTVSYRVIFKSNTSLVYTSFNNLPAGEYWIEARSVSGGLSANYTLVTGRATLYVNPYGNQTKAVKPSLECVTEEGGGLFYAHYSYTNSNAFAVWIPYGAPDNFISDPQGGLRQDPAVKVPSVFNTGTGRFKILFDGSKSITWNLSSFERTQKTSSASIASSSSNKCGNNFTPVPGNTRMTSTTNGSDIKIQENVYPNPFAGRVTIEADLKDVTEKDIKVIDLLGREFRPLSTRKISVTRMELDLSNLVTGQYYIRINSKAGVKVFKVMRQ